METKKALVTGASEGIGRAFAVKLASEGYSITGVARNESKLKELTKELSVQSGQRHRYIVADLSVNEGQNRVAEDLESQHYNLLVNNAGVGTTGNFTDVPLERQLSMLHLNCEAVVHLSYAFLKSSQSGDALINVSSTLAFLPMARLGLYCATKAFVTSFSESLWFEQKKRGVHVLGLCPGLTATNFGVNAGGKPSDTLPKAMTQTSEEVVEFALKSLKNRNKPTIISGAKNAFFAVMPRALPRKVMVNMLGRMLPPS